MIELVIEKDDGTKEGWTLTPRDAGIMSQIMPFNTRDIQGEYPTAITVYNALRNALEEDWMRDQSIQRERASAMRRELERQHSEREQST